MINPCKIPGSIIINTLRITSLKVSTKIGVYAWEQRILQSLLFDLSIPIDMSRYQDNIANALDYAAVCQSITQFVSSQSFQLLETVAEQVLNMLQKKFAIQHMTLTVSKPLAVKNAGPIQICLER